VGVWTSCDKAGQFYNPYGYSNNPVSYVDKDGNFFWIPFAVGAAIGFAGGLAVGADAGKSGWSLLGYGLAGAGVGLASTWGGMALGGQIAVSSLGTAALSGAAGGFAGGGIAGLGMGTLAGLAQGKSFGDALAQGLIWGGAGALAGTFVGAASGMVGYGIQQAALASNAIPAKALPANVTPQKAAEISGTVGSQVTEQVPPLSNVNNALTQAATPNVLPPSNAPQTINIQYPKPEVPAMKLPGTGQGQVIVPGTPGVNYNVLHYQNFDTGVNRFIFSF
jgi:hypothetical protein